MIMIVVAALLMLAAFTALYLYADRERLVRDLNATTEDLDALTEMYLDLQHSANKNSRLHG